MGYIDLHTHSNCSDGTNTPSELVDIAIEQGLVAIAVTDHDTIEGVKEAVEYAKDKDIEVIPGVEISCEYVRKDGRKKEIHILGYNFDYSNEELLDGLTKAAFNRDERNRKMCENLNKAGFPIDYESLIERFGNDVLTRAHFGRFLMEKGVVPTIGAAFDKILAMDGPYFVSREYFSPADGIELIKKAGGVAVVAHPLMYKFSENEIRQMIVDLKEQGIDGVEVMYSRNHNNDEVFCRQLARENDLFMTGGTDYHGKNKPDLSVGTGEGNLKIPEEFLENLR